jgi:cell division septum initiation protein DivIVA
LEVEIVDSEKKFANEMFGYNKQEVEEYVKETKAEYESRLQAEKSDSNRLSNELTIVKKKLERYEIDYIERQEKVANALITAEDQAKKIIENARLEANEERERIEHLIEMEKEKLLDLKKEVIDLKERTIRLMDKYSYEMNSLLD